MELLDERLEQLFLRGGDAMLLVVVAVVSLASFAATRALRPRAPKTTAA